MLDNLDSVYTTATYIDADQTTINVKKQTDADKQNAIDKLTDAEKQKLPLSKKLSLSKKL